MAERRSAAGLGAVFGAHGMGQDTILRNLALLNVLWDGGEMAINQRSKLSFVSRGRRLTFGLMVQPEALRGFLERACSPTWIHRHLLPRRSGSRPGCAAMPLRTTPIACRRNGFTSTFRTASGTAATCAPRSPPSPSGGGRGWRKTGAGGALRSIRRCWMGGSDRRLLLL